MKELNRIERRLARLRIRPTRFNPRKHRVRKTAKPATRKPRSAGWRRDEHGHLELTIGSE